MSVAAIGADAHGDVDQLYVETRELRTDLVYRLRVIVDNPDGGLRQGMPVTVTLDVGGNHDD